MSLPKVIYVMGAPGAGKGTQAEMLAQAIGYVRFSTGDAFREMARQNTPQGRKVDAIIHGQGKLMPPEEAAEIVMNAVKKYVKAGHGLVFDGTPRTVQEAAMVDEFFAANNYSRPLVIHLRTNKEDMIARNSRRQFCLGIEGDFPVVTDDDRRRCESLGGRVGMREHDQAEKINVRCHEFKNKTWPVIEQYEREGVLHTVDGQQSIAEVHTAVMHIIHSFHDKAQNKKGH
jgi:adenylate kinase